MAPRLIATVLAPAEGGYVAVARPEGGFAMPGGHVERGESFAHGAHRELFEETGLIASLLVPLYQQQSPGITVVGFYAPSVWGTLRSSAEGAAAIVSKATLLAGPYGDFARRCFEARASIERRCHLNMPR